jgi:hypothetical protein
MGSAEMAHDVSCRAVRVAAIAALALVGLSGSAADIARADPLLDEMVEFTAQIFFIDT